VRFSVEKLPKGKVLLGAQGEKMKEKGKTNPRLVRKREKDLAVQTRRGPVQMQLH
jgi:hypothetical protein